MSLPKAPSRSTYASLPTGTVLGGTYRIVDKIDQGGMGVVYEVIHQGLGRRQALKVIELAHLSRKMIARFLNEGRTLARFNHPNIVRVFDINIVRDSVGYLAMELLEGETLEECLQKRGALTQDEALRLFGQLLDALFYAHARGVVHRDIKPANIMLIRDDGGRRMVKVFDFGVARYFDDLGHSLALTTTGDIVGSPSHMSPEQGLGKRVDQRTDIYSSGCVLYEMLTGEQLFHGDNALLTLGKHISEDPLERLTERFAGQPELVNFLMLCLAKDPIDRFCDVNEARIALGELASRKIEAKNRDYLTHLKRSASSLGQLPQPALLLLFFVALCLVSFSVIWLALGTGLNMHRSELPVDSGNLLTDCIGSTEQITRSSSDVTSNALRLKEFAAYARDDRKFSTIEKFGDRDMRVFHLLPNIALGVFKSSALQKQAVGDVSFDKSDPLILNCGTGLAVYPQVLRRFQNGDLVGLQYYNNQELRSSALKYVTHIKSLSYLNFRNSALDNEMFDYLEQLPNIESVEFSCTNIDGHGLAAWKGVSKLRYLRAGYINDSQLVLDRFDSKSRLETLNLDGTFINANDMAKIARIKSLKYLNVTCHKIKPEDLALLRDLPALSRLVLNGQDFGPEYIDAIAQLRSLKSLSISQRRWTDKDIERLHQKCPELALEYVPKYNFEYSFKGEP